MLFSVTFNVGMRDDCALLTVVWGERNFAGRREQSLKCFFLRVENCVRGSVDSLYRNTNMWYVEGGCGCFEVVVD